MPRNRGGTCDPWGAHVETDNRREQLDERCSEEKSFWTPPESSARPMASSGTLPSSLETKTFSRS